MFELFIAVLLLCAGANLIRKGAKLLGKYIVSNQSK